VIAKLYLGQKAFVTRNIIRLWRGDWKCETGRYSTKAWRAGKCKTRKWSTEMLLVDVRSSTLSGKSNPLDVIQ